MHPVEALLGDLVALDSATPPGGEEAMASFLAGRLSVPGVQIHTVAFAPGRVSLVAERPGREPGAILLSGHLDTVAPAEGWTTPPHALTARGTRLHGLGACDMKGGVAALVLAFLGAAARGTPRHTLRLLLSADEEDRYRGAARMREAGFTRDATFLVVAEPTGGRVLVAERGAFWVRALFRGREAHGSTPEQGVSATLACARFLGAMERHLAQSPPVPPFGPTSWNPGVVMGGRQVNIVADSCFTEVDFRVGSLGERDRVVALLEQEGARSGAAFTWELLDWSPPCVTAEEDPQVQAFLRVAEKTLGRPVEVGVAHYCTDLPMLFPERPPPFVIWGPGDIRQAHQPDEFVERASLLEAAAVLEAFLAES